MRSRRPWSQFPPRSAAQRARVFLLILLITSCGGQEFSATRGTESRAGSGGDTAGDSPSVAGDGTNPFLGGSGGGTAGRAGGGAGGQASLSGSGGKPATGCDCSAGSYCQDGTTKCRLCTDFLRFEFAVPQKLTTLSQATLSVERFPRLADANGGLFYVVGDAGKESLWYAPTPVSGIGAQVSQTGRFESGPLFAPGFADQNFFFDRRDLTTGKRKLMMANWSGVDLSPGSAVLVPAPLNADADDYSVAIAPQARRAYWMSTRSGQPELLWTAMSAGTANPPAVLDLSVKAGATTCPRLGDDATPWVNLDGTVLLFRSQSVNENCESNDSGAYDLFAVPISKTGIAAGTAITLSSLNQIGGVSTETDPSLSLDSCFIYFASNNASRDFDLYRAARN